MTLEEIFDFLISKHGDVEFLDRLRNHYSKQLDGKELEEKAIEMVGIAKLNSGANKADLTKFYSVSRDRGVLPEQNGCSKENLNHR